MVKAEIHLVTKDATCKQKMHTVGQKVSLQECVDAILADSTRCYKPRFKYKRQKEFTGGAKEWIDVEERKAVNYFLVRFVRRPRELDLMR